MIIFYLIIAILVFDFVLDRVLEWLNSSWRNKPIPTELNGIYDNEKYLKQQEYSKVNSRFSAISSTFSFVLVLVFISMNGFAWVNSNLVTHIEQPIFLSLAFFGVLFIAMDIIGIPFEWYSTFVIEERFGFNRTTRKTFWLDKLKGYLVSAVLGALILSLIQYLYMLMPETFWLYTWLVLTVFMVFMSMFYSNLIVPLFNKQTPLAEGALRDAIEDMGKKAGFSIQNIYEINGSKRSSRANAYFTGFGPRKRIVLYDTLINQLSTEEIVAVLAHEIGHYKRKHTLKGMISGILQSGLMLYLLNLFIGRPELSMALGVEVPMFHIGLAAFAMLYSPISSITGIISNLFTRKYEYQADTFAANIFSAEYLISALKKLSSENLSNLTPHPAYVFVNYSHPTLFQRILNLKAGNGL